ncbi:MAG TPA: hypothetical protein VNY05_04925 [Candidatus Acidoferrales bacterium]|jgi:hypothetical protein|nr:hypothetical protein [Candidatus Acidoferrales bacterium]
MVTLLVARFFNMTGRREEADPALRKDIFNPKFPLIIYKTAGRIFL